MLYNKQTVLRSSTCETSIEKLDQQLTEMWNRLQVQNRLFGGVVVCIGIALFIVGIWIPMVEWVLKGLLISIAFLFAYFGRQVLILTPGNRFVSSKVGSQEKLQCFLTEKREFDKNISILAANLSLIMGFCFLLCGLAQYLSERRIDPALLWALMVGFICLGYGWLTRRMAH